MRTFRLALAALILATSTAACATSSDATSGTSDDQINTAERNQDVQALKVYNAESFAISKNSIYGKIDPEACKPEGTGWPIIKGHDTDTQGFLSVTLDCTAAVQEKFGYPVMRAIKATGSRTRKADEGQYGVVSFSNSSGSFWAKTVELVVKQAAIDSPTFNGIGFYLNSFSYRYYEAPPAPGANNGNGYFIFADQVRELAGRFPPAKLASGESVRVIKVLLASEYANGGSSVVPGFYFRPFAEYVSGTDKHQRWDSVASDYFVSVRTDFNREGDILAR